MEVRMKKGLFCSSRRGRSGFAGRTARSAHDQGGRIMRDRFCRKHLVRGLTAVMLLMSSLLSLGTGEAATCERNIVANIVALDQSIMHNRLGAFNPAGMMFALRRDVVDLNGVSLANGGAAVPGQVRLREDKRPRPLVLRMNEGDCLTVNLQNLLAQARVDNEQPATRSVSFTSLGMQLVNNIGDDGTFVGRNAPNVANVGQTRSYRIYAEKEGTFLFHSGTAMTGGEGDGGHITMGLFGTINVQKRGAEWYRSQVTQSDIQLASTGQTADGHPIINYGAVYPVGHVFAGTPILNMLFSNEIIHSDINAIITGPNRGNFPAGTYVANEVIAPTRSDDATPRSRLEPYREFTVVFHDEIFAVQAFPEFNTPNLAHTLHSVRDGFAINYGVGGAGAEVLANRKGVGPMHGCTECKFEEFFLTSWAVGDPAMIVDIPANAVDGLGALIQGPKATKALYPDDPSNVHHSYLGDHVKFRNVHAGPKEHHIFHLHAHQWLSEPDDDRSNYLDSQAIGPGSGYTYEITYNGSGNRNLTVGDSIFHCHFYPHFAQGMWELWRVHDVFEAGTQMVADAACQGQPNCHPLVAPGARALPDGEIPTGTPIPALVPLPTRAMAPMPAVVQINGGQAEIAIGDVRNPGYPFYLAAEAGHRPPKPPLDTVHDGGLPRHIIVGGNAVSHETRLDMSKEIVTANAIAIPETGTDVELAAMAFHAQRFHNSYFPSGAPATGNAGFKTNGRPAAAGAPFADPCVNDFGAAAGLTNGDISRRYKMAAIQLDMTMNKLGWHFPQSRILSLWQDVDPLLAGTKAPEPLFFRAQSGECIELWHTNLVPHIYQQDDYQVKTPTDVIGQHIHLVKFDVTSSDGSGNGFNYEDGTFSPGEVIERINAINAFGGLLVDGVNNIRAPLAAAQHPFFAGQLGLGAQTTVQRWYADPVVDERGRDRTLRTIFTHDHFGPSTHQQAGLYASFVIEPAGSQWRDPETGALLGGRDDGGPTSWRADIHTRNRADSYREFLFQFADFQLAYAAGTGGTAAAPVPSPAGVINPPAKEEAPLPVLVQKAAVCPTGVDGLPGNIATEPFGCPEAISAADVGTFSVNYRNEPVAARILNAAGTGQATGKAGDLAHVYRSDVTREIAAMNTQPAFYPALTPGVQPGDPYTPLIRVFQGDKVQVRVQVGATEEGHVMTFHGLKWLKEPKDFDSGYRNAQMLGISEHFELETPLLPNEGNFAPWIDYLYQFDASKAGQWNGLWGLMRAYGTRAAAGTLQPLPNNSIPAASHVLTKITNLNEYRGGCPLNAPVRSFDVTAIPASSLPGGTLTYNSRPDGSANHPGPLQDASAEIYVRTSDLNANGTLRNGVPVEPLVLRARAGECIEVTLRNRLPQNPADIPGYSGLPMLFEGFNANDVRPTNEVGLRSQLLAVDVSRFGGTNVGFNLVKQQTANPGRHATYRWYAGDISLDVRNRLVATPVEFGATNLLPADLIKQPSKGLVGALIIEPQNANWEEDENSRASATVTVGNTFFREFVLVMQDAVNMQAGNNVAIPNGSGAEDTEDSGQKAFNYRSEPMWFRLGFEPNTGLSNTNNFNFASVLSNTTVGAEPQTPIFTADAGDPIRFRVLHGGGSGRNGTFALHGHIWQRAPYTNLSRSIGLSHSMWVAQQEGMGPGQHFDVVPLNGAGGGFRVQGDYLYRDQASFLFDSGLWGILRVGNGGANGTQVPVPAPSSAPLTTVQPASLTESSSTPASATARGGVTGVNAPQGTGGMTDAGKQSASTTSTPAAPWKTAPSVQSYTAPVEIRGMAPVGSGSGAVEVTTYDELPVQPAGLK